MSSTIAGTDPTLRRVGRVAAPLLAMATYALLPEQYVDPRGNDVVFGHAGRATAGVMVWMAIWWMTEAIPLYATALLPLVLFPLTGARTIRETASPYAHELIFLFMGGFLLALSMQRWGLDRRISLLALRLAGTRPSRIVGAFMGVTALLSMWVSNTATAVMMLPIALGAIQLVEGQPRSDASDQAPSPFATSLLLGIAYAASIGGVGTLIGTPPNLFLASYASSNLGIEIGFVRWMSVGLPLVAIFLPLSWLLLTRVLFPMQPGEEPSSNVSLETLWSELGEVKPGERATAIVFGLTAAAWMTRPWLSEIEWGGFAPLAGLTDPGIAITAGIALFLIPVDSKRGVFVMDWETANGIPWGLLLLFGGGLSLAAAIRANGLGEYIGQSVGFLSGVPSLVLIAGIVTLLIFLTEITSNTATAATMIPILASLAPGLDVHPLALIVPAAIASSCAFMLPVATPPNAVVFGSGRVPLAQMARSGIWLNLVGIALITGLCYALVIPALGSAGAGSSAMP